jgi:hypothetical protein
MISRIVGFGDSWIFGDGLQEVGNQPTQRKYRVQNGLIGQLAAHLAIPYDSATVVNHGVSGGSLQSTQWEFAQWAMRQENFGNTLVVIGLTESSRQSWFTKTFDQDGCARVNYAHSHTPGCFQGWENFIKFANVYANDKEMWSLNYWLTTEFFGSWAKINNIPLCMFNVFPAPITSPYVIEPEWNARGELARLEHESGNVTAPCKHPNEKGYHLLAKYLHKLLESSKII